MGTNQFRPYVVCSLPVSHLAMRVFENSMKKRDGSVLTQIPGETFLL